MSDESAGRRSDDSWRSRIEDRLERAVRELTSHVSGCTQIQNHAKEWRDDQAQQTKEMNDKLDKLLLARAGDAGERRGRVWTARLVWIALVAAAGVIGFLIEHAHPIAH